MKTTIEINDFVWTFDCPIVHGDFGFFDTPIPDSGTLDQLKSMMFKAFYNLARPIVEVHGGDLFHDATFLNEHMTADNANGFEVYFAVRKYGTHIGMVEAGMYMAEHNEFTYKVTLGHDGKRWKVVSELVSANG